MGLISETSHEEFDLVIWAFHFEPLHVLGATELRMASYRHHAWELPRRVWDLEVTEAWDLGHVEKA